MSCRVLIMAGGTGGHIFPALAVARELERADARIRWLGARDGMETRIVPEAGIEMDTIRIKGLRGKGIAGWLLSPARLCVAAVQVFAVILRFRPDVVLGMGGFVSGPGGFVSWLLHRPLVIHEQNAIPGLTNRLLSRIATRTMTAFKEVFAGRKNVEYVGNPVRAEMLELAAPQERFGDRGPAIRLLVLGGSLGAQVLNETLPAVLSECAEGVAFDVRHQSGRSRDEVTRAAYAQHGIPARVEPFIADMAEAYCWADLVICRAGALTLSELMAVGLGAVLVPYPYAVDDHQTVNARDMVEAGAARVVQQGEGFKERLREVLAAHVFKAATPDRRTDLLVMAVAAHRLAMPGASMRVAQVCMEVAG